jgi:hypothetical protein
MRSLLLGPTAIVLAASTLGCAQVAGIQDVSGSMADQHCVDSTNKYRAMLNLPPLTRGLDSEQCADELAQALTETTITPPGCWTAPATASYGGAGMADPDSLLQQLVDSQWNTPMPSHGYLGQTFYTQLACGYATSASMSVAVMLFQ